MVSEPLGFSSPLTPMNMDFTTMSATVNMGTNSMLDSTEHLVQLKPMKIVTLTLMKFFLASSSHGAYPLGQ